MATNDVVRWVGVVVAAALLVACGATDPGPRTGERPLTGGEAERLAVVRYQNLARGVVPVRLALRIDDQNVVLDGDVDMRRGLGYAAFVATGSQGSAGLIQWTARSVALLPNGATVTERPPPESGWQVRSLAPEASRLDTALATVLALASDRPENPLLLQQNGATYLSHQELRGHDVDVFRGPEVLGAGATPNASRLTYLVDDAGVLHRVNVDLPGSDGPLTIDLFDGAAPGIPLIGALRAGRS